MYGKIKEGVIVALQSDESYERTDISVKAVWVKVPDDLSIPVVDGQPQFPAADPSWVNPDAANLPPFPPAPPESASDE